MTTNTEQTPPAGQQAAALQTEATELQTDIKEAQTEAAAARTAGDHARAERLEASIAETKTELGEIKTLLKGLTDRPFHPAPGDGQTPPAPPAGEGAGEQQTPPAQTEEPPADTTPKKRHWLYGDRWNKE